MRTTMERNSSEDFLDALVTAASFEPLEVGKDYAYRCYAGSEPTGYTWEFRTATEADVKQVNDAISANDLLRFNWRIK